MIYLEPMESSKISEFTIETIETGKHDKLNTLLLHRMGKRSILDT